MTSRFHMLAPITLVIALATGCGYTAPVIPGMGFLFSSTRAPLDPTFETTQVGAKTGKATVTTILGLFSTGDASAASAARNGGITTIRHADYEWFSVLGIYSTFTTVVEGD